MKDLIAYCGLDCEKCEARIATINNDEQLKIKVAKEWSTLNGVEILPEFINCMGCRVKGVKTPYCESMCPVMLCAKEKKMETCKDCSSKGNCPNLKPFSNNVEAKNNIEI